MTPAAKPARMAFRRTACALVLAAAPALGACASDGPVRPEREVPSELQDVRDSLADQRDATQERLDMAMGGNGPLVADAQPWYAPVFDALDFAASLAHLLW